MHSFAEQKEGVSVGKALTVLALSAVLGIGSGWALVTVMSEPGGGVQKAPVTKQEVAVGQTYGSDDRATFTDTAEGDLQEGGIEGEGQYHLVRKGGESQNVYLTSSVIDLSLFVGRKIKVWGETQQAQKAGWLMDVGKVEVVE